jgi:hypothetical protein
MVPPVLPPTLEAPPDEDVPPEPPVADVPPPPLLVAAPVPLLPPVEPASALLPCSLELHAIERTGRRTIANLRGAIVHEYQRSGVDEAESV